MRPRLTSTAFRADDMEALDRELKKLAAQVKEREARVAQAGAPAPPPVPSAPPAPPTVMVCYLESTPSVAGLVEDGGHFRHSVFIYAFVGVFLVLVVAAASANGRRPRSR